MFAEMLFDNRTMNEIAAWTVVDAQLGANLRTKDGE
jgi:hypothetical protein